jgi:hypothetical protein
VRSFLPSVIFEIIMLFLILTFCYKKSRKITYC